MNDSALYGQTHEVTNQPSPFEDINLFASDRALGQALERFGGGWGVSRAHEFGSVAGGELLRLGYAANLNKPVLKTHDRYGHRIDTVDFHPAYHQIMARCIEHELHALPWREPRPGAQVLRSTLGYLHGQVEAGTGCPITMTYACVPALRQQPDVFEAWRETILSTAYDPSCQPVAAKSGATIGMGMTEKQGGSDVRGNTTRARPLGTGGPGQAYELVGHKWFFSAPMCDAFLVLAQTDRGLSCFLLPRWRPDGSRNAIRIQRLKDKLGNWSNASSEVEFTGAHATLIGEEGRGVPTIIEMVMHTRLDCITGSAALMRQAFAQAAWHVGQRAAFGRTLIDQPLMQNVLADLAIESEAAMLLALRAARAVDDAAQGDAQAAALARILLPVAKYWVCKRTPAMVNEAQECLGGAGYVEEHLLARLYREAPLNSIWEGCGNVQCLDVLRALAREPDSLEALVTEFESLATDGALRASRDRLKDSFADLQGAEFRARRLVEDTALLLQAGLMRSNGDAASADAFVGSRLGDGHRAFGTLDGGADAAAIIARAAPAA